MSAKFLELVSPASGCAPVCAVTVFEGSPTCICNLKNFHCRQTRQRNLSLSKLEITTIFEKYANNTQYVLRNRSPFFFPFNFVVIDLNSLHLQSLTEGRQLTDNTLFCFFS